MAVRLVGCREATAGDAFGTVFPAALARLEDRIHEIVGMARWVR